MSSRTALASPVESSFSNPSDYAAFFTEGQDAVIRKKYVLGRETTPFNVPGKSCNSNLFLGFFHDGTRNNYALSQKNKDESHSNVARLFDTYPGQAICPAMVRAELGDSRWSDEGNYPNYFRVYIPGVGTPFEEVKDSGEGLDRTEGAAFARWGERRLTWGLAQAINAVYRYFFKSSLLTDSDVLNLVRQADIDRRNLRSKPRYSLPTDYMGPEVAVNTMALFQDCLGRLHKMLKLHMHAPGERPAKIDPGCLQVIYVSAFGFSRGAAAARVFTRWLVALCQLDAQMLGRSGLTLAGFPVTFDFLGIFDTVASVGLAASSLVGDGHGGWADAEVSMRFDQEVARCLHLVSAHEVRRSFPLDSISVNGVLPDQCDEIVFPGVHSDVGGGYTPKEQGRGTDGLGGDMLSRIPLAVMYREARLAGVPLKLERAAATSKKRFLIAASTINAFNAYIAASEAYAAQRKRSDTPLLRNIMRTQMELAILWRKGWAGHLSQMPSVQRAAQEDTNDMVSADREFVAEIQRFDYWRKHKMETMTTCDPMIGACQSTEVRNVPGVDPGRFDEWEDIDRFWSMGSPAPAIADLFENYAHDSRAWFKLTGWEAGEVKKGLADWAKTYQAYLDALKSPYDGFVPSCPFTAEEEGWIKAYMATGKVPPMATTGREPFALGAGYLRFRRVYAGGDSLRITMRMGDTRPVQLAQQDDEAVVGDV